MCIFVGVLIVYAVVSTGSCSSLPVVLHDKVLCVVFTSLPAIPCFVDKLCDASTCTPY